MDTYIPGTAYIEYDKRRARAYDDRYKSGWKQKQSYADYVAFLNPKIWEIPEVRIGPSARRTLIARELLHLNRDIREVTQKIHGFELRMKYLQQRSRDTGLHREEIEELSKIGSMIKKRQLWKKDLEGFKKDLTLHE